MPNTPKKFSLSELKKYVACGKFELSNLSIIEGLGDKEWKGVIYLFESAISLHSFLSKGFTTMNSKNSKLFFEELGRGRGMMRVDSIQLGKLSKYQWLFFDRESDRELSPDDISTLN